jgi:Spy/CpxP family protein refolding chaperone
MKMKHAFTLVLVCAAVLAASAQTATHQPPSPADIAAHRVKTLTTLLSLTSAQQQQATTIYTNAAKAEQTAHESEKEAHASLRTAIKNNDTETIDQVSNTIAQAMAQMTSIRAKADAALYQILTADQQTKLTELESEHMGLLDGPGGPPAMGFR